MQQQQQKPYPPLRPKPKDQPKIELHKLRPLMNRWTVASILIVIGIAFSAAESSIAWLSASRTPVQQVRGPR